MGSEADVTDQEAILRAIESFAASYNSGDLSALLSYYDDDLVKVRQGAQAESKADTERRVKDVFTRFDTKVEVENLEIEVSGDMAFTRGIFTVTLSPRDGGEAQQVVRRYLEVWRKRAGKWRVARTMDNGGDAASRPTRG
jgi:ketosteroid isomerase-like protein